MRQFLPSLICAVALALPAGLQAKDTVKADLPLAKDGVVVVELINGSLDITGGRNDGVQMTAEVKGGLKTFTYESDGHTARFKQDSPKFRLHWDGKVDLTLSVPEGVDVRIDGVNNDVDLRKLTGEVRVDLVNGDLSVEPGCRSVHVESVNGAVVITGVAEGVYAESVNGRIHLEEVSGDIEADTVNGSINVQGGRVTRAKLTTLNGDIDWRGMPQDEASIFCDTHSGSIAVMIPERLHSSVRAETFSGGIHSDFRGAVQKTRHMVGKDLSFEIGSGKHPVVYQLSSFSGSIDVARMD